MNKFNLANQLWQGFFQKSQPTQAKNIPVFLSTDLPNQNVWLIGQRVPELWSDIQTKITTLYELSSYKKILILQSQNTQRPGIYKMLSGFFTFRITGIISRLTNESLKKLFKIWKTIFKSSLNSLNCHVLWNTLYIPLTILPLSALISTIVQ